MWPVIVTLGLDGFTFTEKKLFSLSGVESEKTIINLQLAHSEIITFSSQIADISMKNYRAELIRLQISPCLGIMRKSAQAGVIFPNAPAN